MSNLAAKNVLVVGEESQQILLLEERLASEGALIHKSNCGEVTEEHLISQDIHVVILNHLHDGDVCKNTLLTIRDSRQTRVIPVFVMVDGSEEKVQEAYSLGAADYILPEEGVDSILTKLKAVIGQDSEFGDASVIDITPETVKVSKKGVRVYVVEDDPLLRNLLSIKLNKSDFPYEFSSDGRNVIEAMLQFKPDIVILDLMLPGKSGFDVLAEIKAHETLRNLPVLVFSNRDGQDDKHKAEELGAVGFYVKAMTDLSELIETIESHAA